MKEHRAGNSPMIRKAPSDWLLVLLLIAGVYLWQRTAFPLWMIDLLPIQLAAHQWAQGGEEWMYAPVDRFEEWYARCDSIAASLGGEGFGNPYFYPPFVATTLSPVSHVDAKSWRNVLFAINVALIFVFAHLIRRVCRVRNGTRGYLWAIALVLICYPMSRATKLGQIVPLLAAVTWFGLLWLRDQRNWKSGLVLGLVSATKLFPLGFIALPMLAKRYQVAAVWVGSFVGAYAVSVLLLGWRIHALFWQALSEFGTLVYPYQGNQSLLGWWVRLFRDKSLVDIIPFTDSGVETAHAVIVVIVMGGTLGWLWLHRHAINADSFAAFMGLLIAGILLSLSTAWEHYWLWALPVLGWAIHEEWTRGESRFRLFWIFAASFFFLMKLTRFYVDTPIGRLITGSHTVGMLMFWMWLLWRVRQFALMARSRTTTDPILQNL